MAATMGLMAAGFGLLAVAAYRWGVDGSIAYESAAGTMV
jgi:hypothetical protein